MRRVVGGAALLLALLAAALVPLTSSAADSDGDGDSAAARVQPLFATLTETEAERVARADRVFAATLRQRPGAGVRVRFVPSARRWRVSVRDRGTGVTLATVEIDDQTGEVVEQSALPIGDYPSRTSHRQAIDAAVADPGVRRVAREWGGVEELRATATLDRGSWEVDLFDPDRSDGGESDLPVVRVDVSDAARSVTGVWTGHQIAWKMARGDRDAFGGALNERHVWLPLLVLFALVTVDWVRLRSWFNADVLAVLALGVSHELFLQGEIEWSVPLAVPPLLWLLGRMAWIFARGLPAQCSAREPRGRVGRLALRRVPTMLLVVLCVALAGMRIGITLDGGNVIDVGYAGVAGARQELAGEAPWGNMPDDNPRGDTYGPANYLAYVPATVLFDDPDAHEWGDPLPAAQATAIAADLGCVLLLALIGWRWISRRGAVLLAAGWLACPWTAWALASGVNDSLLALSLLAAFALVPRPLLRGLLVGVAAMVKFAPIVVLAPLLHVGGERRLRQSLLAITGCALAIAGGLAWVTFRLDAGPLADLRLFWERTVGFQAGRGSPFSPWGMYSWETAQRIAQGAVAALLLAAGLLPRSRDAWQAAAGAAAALIAVQLVVTHWFYLYVPWFIGFVLLVLVAARERPGAAGYASAP